jgi:peptidoglycan/xylan/chitin deacetylase (PgdA/CDA1 family)
LDVAALLENYGMPGTFYVAPANREIPLSRRLDARGIGDLSRTFEIGGHTMTHPRLTTLPLTESEREVVTGRRFLQDCTGQPITAFCYPGGCYDARHPALVAAAGFTLARTVERHVTRLGPSPFEVGTTFHAYRHLSDPMAAWRMAGARGGRAWRYYRDWDTWAIACFDRVFQTGGVYHLWGHSWEIDSRHDWLRLERVLKHVSGRPDVRYVDNSGLRALFSSGIGTAECG